MADDPAAKPDATPAQPAADVTPATAAEVVAPSIAPLGGADAGKREGAEAKPDAKANGHDTSAAAPDAAAKPDATAKPDSGGETAAKAPPADGGEAKPPEPKPAEPKPAEAKPEGEAKPPEPADKKDAPAETPPAPPVYDALRLPENVKLDDTRVKKLDELIGKTETTTKAEHAAMTALRQELVNMHVEEVTRINQQASQHQRDVWNRLIEQRFNELKSDPQLGGNRIETTLGNAKYALESLVGLSKQEAGELIAIMDAGGVSHHRLTIKMLNGIYELLREPEAISPALPGHPSKSNEPGQRGWYNTVDGIKV